MGNLVSLSTPKTEASNFHQLSALDIDKQQVQFNTLEGKVGPGAGAPLPCCPVALHCRLICPGKP